MAPISSSIVPIREVRTCKEHMCRILRRKMLWVRCFLGLLTFDITKTARVSTEGDWRGRVAVWHVNIYLRRRFGDASAPDHVVLEAYCGLTATGEITGSGLMDPKDIIIGGIEYCQLSNAKPNCDLCTSGDMIPMEERFMGARYAPPTPPLSESRKAKLLRKKDLLKKWDWCEQRLALIWNYSKMYP